MIYLVRSIFVSLLACVWVVNTLANEQVQPKYQSSSLSFMLKKLPYEILSKSALNLLQVEVLAIKNGQNISTTWAPIEIVYKNSQDEVLEKETEKLLTRNCQRNSSAPFCARKVLDLNYAFYNSSCRLEIRISNDLKSMRWGRCQNSSSALLSADLSLEYLENSSNPNLSALKYSIQNSGDRASKPFRILFEYLDYRGEIISYEFASLDKIRPQKEQTFTLDPKYLSTFACQIRYSIDLDGKSEALVKSHHRGVFDYGDCVKEDFIPYEDLALRGVKILSKDNRHIDINIQIKNMGDVAVLERDLTIILEGFDINERPTIKNQEKNSRVLGPKEEDIVQFKVAKFFFDELCRLKLSLRPDSSIQEFNQSNNIKTLNLCSASKGELWPLGLKKQSYF